MRTALAAAGLLLVTACSSPPPADPPPVTIGQSSPAAPAQSSAAAAVLTWGGSGSSSGVFIQVDAPTASDQPVIGVDGKPDPQRRFVLVPVTAGNKTTGKARLSFKGRVGQKEAPRVQGAEDDTGEFPDGEGGRMQARIEVPVDASELALEVYANVDGQPTNGRLQFKGPLP